MARGWVLDGLRAFDAFPMTHHVECVATCSRSRLTAAPGGQPSAGRNEIGIPARLNALDPGSLRGRPMAAVACPPDFSRDRHGSQVPELGGGSGLRSAVT